MNQTPNIRNQSGSGMKPNQEMPRGQAKNRLDLKKIALYSVLGISLGSFAGDQLGGSDYLSSEQKYSIPNKESEVQNDPETQKLYECLPDIIEKHQYQGLELLHKLEEEGTIETSYKKKIIDTIEKGDEHAMQELIKEAAVEEMMGAKGLLCVLSLLLLVAVIRTALSGKPFGFRLHACAASLYAAMAIVEPSTILHETGMSAIMISVVFTLARLARGVVNKKDLTQLDPEAAKHVVRLLSPLGNIMNGLATSRILSPAISKLANDETRYQAMQAGPNIMAGAGVGDMPFIVPQLNMPGSSNFGFFNIPLFKGNAYTWQAKVMFPIMLRHRFYQANLWKISPQSVWKYRKTVREVVSNTRYRRDRVFGYGENSAQEVGLADDLKVAPAGLEEVHTIKEFLIHLGECLEKDGVSTKEINEIVHNLEDQIDNLPFDGHPHGDGFFEEGGGSTGEGEKDSTNTNNDETKHHTYGEKWESIGAKDEFEVSFEQTSDAISEISQFIKNEETKDDMNCIAEVLINAIKNGQISKQQLEDFEHSPELFEIITQLPGLKGIIRRREKKADKVFMKTIGKIKGDDVEAEVFRVLPLQTLLVPLISPLIIVATQHFPSLIDPITAAGTTVLDNMVQAAMSWSVNNPKAIAYSIIFGAFFTISNMANILALGKHASFKKSLQYSKWIIPTGLFALGYLNSNTISDFIKEKTKDIQQTWTIGEYTDDPDTISNISIEEKESLKNKGVLYTRPDNK